MQLNQVRFKLIGKKIAKTLCVLFILQVRFQFYDNTFPLFSNEFIDYARKQKKKRPTKKRMQFSQLFEILFKTFAPS